MDPMGNGAEKTFLLNFPTLFHCQARERFMTLCEEIPDAAIDTESTASEESDVQIVKARV